MEKPDFEKYALTHKTLAELVAQNNGKESVKFLEVKTIKIDEFLDDKKIS